MGLDRTLLHEFLLNFLLSVIQGIDRKVVFVTSLRLLFGV